MNEIEKLSTKILKQALGSSAEFREAQLEAIESVFSKKKTLIVRKTGWGKSLVYFIATKINRYRNKGVTIVITPLLSLMQNQISQAKKYNLEIAHMCYKNKINHDTIIKRLIKNEIDVLFTTPESLFSALTKHLKNITIGMFVIDECHCITDWGHDFRLSYTQIKNVIKFSSLLSFPILCTTATANTRIIDDLKTQIGEDLYISRGPLFRDNIYIQPLEINKREQRYAWILDFCTKTKKLGIIFCLTTAECDSLAKFLSTNRINAESYHSHKGSEDIAQNILNKFINNNIQVLVSTIKLGMGFDMPNIYFVIHYNLPKNLLNYYQQVGRAARNIEKGYSIIIRGSNDISTLQYFVNNKFPSEENMKKVYNAIADEEIRTIESLLSRKNEKKGEVEKCIKYLYYEGFITSSSEHPRTYFRRVDRTFKYNKEHYDEITRLSNMELAELDKIYSGECINKIVLNSLDDYSIEKCGVCCNCNDKPYFTANIKPEYLLLANNFLNTDYMPLECKYECDYIPGCGNQYSHYNTTEGIILSKYGDEGIGGEVASCKHKNINFPAEVLDKAVNVLKIYFKKNDTSADIITCIPSLNNTLVDNFCERLSNALGIPFIKTIKKIKDTHQKSMYNKYYQKQNVVDSYQTIKDESKLLYNKRVLLVDDMVDSGYTLAILGLSLLENNKADKVIPLALADSSRKDAEDE
ncbi:MAG: RecQ family ATP-dependent DNA helicase [Acholeplasmatales bacterium]|jgi:ATP-dependent DNA helicase RecQ|nr:RecQ family ATP-dependent DNA helicase [Acholeplasmatales bacterium]